MANETDAPKPRGVQGLFAAIFTPKNPNATQSEAETRERIRTLDETERKWGWAAAALPLALSISDLFIKYKVAPITAKPDNGHCVSGFRLVKSLCTQIHTTSALQSLWVTGVIFVLGLVLLYGVWRSKRSFAAFSSFLAGIASGTLGLILVFFGGWLLVRAWRIQRYGAADGKTVRKVSMERAAERKAAKKAGATETLPSGKVVPPPSKRYTPKAKPKKK